jgi:hypothetical protein
MYIATSDMLYDLGRLCPNLVELSLKGQWENQDFYILKSTGTATDN